jgi:hypothetical protein
VVHSARDPKSVNRRLATRRAAARAALVALTLCAAAPARAQLALQADAAVNLGYDREGWTDDPRSRGYVELRPGLAAQFGSPRLSWRASYVLAATGTLYGDAAGTYGHAADLSLVGELGRRSMVTLGAGLTYGGAEFRLLRSPPGSTAPALREGGDTRRVAATASQSWSWEATPRLGVGQTLTARVDAPASATEDRNLDVSATLRLDGAYERDALGTLASGRYVVLQPGGADGPRVEVVTSSLQAVWNRDLDQAWSAQVTGGVEQLLVLETSTTEMHPAGTAVLRYQRGRAGGSLSYTRAATASLETGTMSNGDEVVLGAQLDLASFRQRQVRASVGYLRSSPFDATPEAAAGDAEVVRVDTGLIWELLPELMGSARYSLAYQYGSRLGTGSGLVQVLMVGITWRWTNDRSAGAMPRRGERVDGADAVGFPGSAPEP